MQAATHALWEGEYDLTLRLWAVMQDGAVACVLVDSVELDRREGVLRCVTDESQNLVSWPNPWQVGRPQWKCDPRDHGRPLSSGAATLLCLLSSTTTSSVIFRRGQTATFSTASSKGVWVPSRAV